MNVSVPLWMVVVQWAALLGLGALVIVIYRQFGYVLGLIGASADDGLNVGQLAPEFTYRVGNEVHRIKWTEDDLTLLVFADPFCGSCIDLLEDLERRGGQVTLGVNHAIIATTASIDEYSLVGAFRTTSWRIVTVERNVQRTLFASGVTPMAFVVGREGSVVAKGAVHSAKDVKQLLRAHKGHKAERKEERELTAAV